MVKNTEEAKSDKRRTAIKDLPAQENDLNKKELTKKEMTNIQGGRRSGREQTGLVGRGSTPNYS